jgi:hypothetical protein
MRPIPENLKIEIADDPYYKHCAREDNLCSGRITWEHVWIYARKQINEKWAIIPLCWYHHLGAGLDKEANEWLFALPGHARRFASLPTQKLDAALLIFIAAFRRVVPATGLVQQGRPQACELHQSQS